MATRDSTLYTKLHVNKFLGDARDAGGRAVPVPFEHLTVSGEAAADKVNLCVLPANCEVLTMEAITPDGLGPSAGSNVNPTIGDAADVDRFMLATDMDVANTRGVLSNGVGMRFRPTADTIVQLTYTVAPAVGRTIRGYFWVIPGA